MADDASTKQCTYCKQVKPVDQFGKHKQGRNGLNPNCKECNKARVKAYQDGLGEQYKLRKAAYDRVYRAENPRDRGEYWRANREHLNRKKKLWALQNPEKSRAIKQNYKHRRRVQESDGMTWAQLMQWRREQKKVCYWCGTKSAKVFHVDHYTPLSKGGKHEASNLVLACPPCNFRKSAKDPMAFAREFGRLL